ncbi:VOC family protein [Solimonas terrae]|uniref:VOC family protein n=1 Tax=Solimonas terrae TaxID=1396819 RepID=A0A6M2BLX1_9GAMM|nr:VOC family protein [Solimonas terrae]NGY03616.1 VOC family protein [Solimonas terrae]
MQAGFGPIKQLAYVVEDLDASIEHWTRFVGVGPWTVYRNTIMQGRYRGTPTTVSMHVGLSYQDELQIELIQVVSRTPSPYQGAAGQPLIGMHHVARHSTNLEADVAAAQARGLCTAFAAGNGVVQVAYLESAREPGLLLELIEASPAVLDGFATGVAASRQWDGRTRIIETFDLGA